MAEVDQPRFGLDGGVARPSRIIIEGPGGAVVGEGPPGGGGPIRPRSEDKGPMNWNDLSRIHDVDELSDDDLEVLGELAEVLRGHGAQSRFGITLLHSHFDLEDEEVLVERVDAERRMLSVRTERIGQFERGELVPTAWRFIGQRMVPLQYCYRPKDGIFHMT